MSSIRARLATAYAATILGTMVALGGAVVAARWESAKSELAGQAAERADLALRILRQARLSFTDPIIVSTDSLVGIVISPRASSLLEAIPDYHLVLDLAGRRLFTSSRVRALDDTSRAAIDDALQSIEYPGPALKVIMRRDELYMVERRDIDASGRTYRSVVGVSTRGIRLAQRQMLGTLLIVAPLLLGASVIGAYVISGRAVEPIDRIINEMEAITDGRSLHKRLAIESTGDELARLGTTLNAMIARLETSFGALRRFTADASHELKTPLAVLRADVERAMHSSTTATEQLVALEEALHETTRMADLVDSLLTLARADEGRFDLHREPVSLGALAKDVLETATILGEGAQLDVSMPLAEDLWILGDHTRLRQLFLNLITNAIKYTPRGGSVELSLTRHDSNAVFTVRDTGIGIAAVDLPYIFERFWRADRSRSRAAERGGFGLGLAISHWIAQAHGGTLTCQSRLNRGTTFTATFPVGPGEPSKALPSEATGGNSQLAAELRG